MSGVRQLGLFAGAALIFSLGLMLVLLPKIFKNKPQVPELALANIRIHRQYSKITVAVFAMLAIAAAAGLMKIEIHGDVRQYDMSHGVCDKAEQQVSEIFQKSERLVSRSNLREAIQKGALIKLTLSLAPFNNQTAKQ